MIIELEAEDQPLESDRAAVRVGDIFGTTDRPTRRSYVERDIVNTFILPIFRAGLPVHRPRAVSKRAGHVAGHIQLLTKGVRYKKDNQNGDVKSFHDFIIYRFYAN